MLYFIAGVFLGIFIPAPYVAVARKTASAVWDWVKDTTTSLTQRF